MTPFQAFIQDFKKYEILKVYNNEGVLIRELLTPNKIKVLTSKLKTNNHVLI